MISISRELEINLSNVANKEELVVEHYESVRPFNIVGLNLLSEQINLKAVLI